MLKRLMSILVAVIICANIGFWILVGIDFSPVSSAYRNGSIIRMGSAVLVFGHGSWETEDGVLRHYTSMTYEGEEIHRPTLDVVKELRRSGARFVWGTWCYSGNHPYIEKDLVTGKEIPWPSYVSRNKRPGETIPVWMGVGFVRISKPSSEFLDAPDQFELVSDTLVTPEWRSKAYGIDLREIVQNLAESMFSEKNGFVVKVDSVSGVSQDTVYKDDSRGDRAFQRFEKLPPWISDEIYYRERARVQAIRQKEQEEFTRAYTSATKIEKVQVWIHGKLFNVWVKVTPEVLYPIRLPPMAVYQNPYI